MDSRFFASHHGSLVRAGFSVFGFIVGLFSSDGHKRIDSDAPMLVPNSDITLSQLDWVLASHFHQGTSRFIGQSSIRWIGDRLLLDKATGVEIQFLRKSTASKDFLPIC
jgi:hypothetical protein